MKSVILPKRYVPFFPDAEWVMEASLDNPEVRKQLLEITSAANASLSQNQLRTGSALFVGTSGDPVQVSNVTRVFKS